MVHSVSRIALLLTALPLASFANGQTLTSLPAGAGGLGGLSSDGTYVVGYDNTSGGAYIWSHAQGVVPLGAGDAVAVSTNGTQVYGRTTNALGEDEASLYFGGTWIPLGTFVGGSSCSGTLTSPYDMSNDGTCATGLAWEGCSGRAYHWNGSTVTKLPKTGGSSRGNAVSGDGRFVGGWDSAPNGTRRAAIWDTANGNAEVLPLISAANPSGAGETWGFSTNGRYAVGQGTQAWRYDTTTGEVVLLGTLPNASSADIGIARAVSDDGKTIVGLAGAVFGTPWRAWIWTEGGGIEVMTTYLTNAGISVPSNMYGAFDMSADGRTILGAYSSLAGFGGDGWVLELPAIDNLGGSTTGTGGFRPVLGANGTVTPGSPFFLCLADGAPASTSILFLAAGATPLPLLGGTFWAVPVVSFIQPLPTDPAGEWVISTSWPVGLPSGLGITLQTLVADSAAVGGYALSNGLRITTP